MRRVEGTTSPGAISESSPLNLGWVGCPRLRELAESHLITLRRKCDHSLRSDALFDYPNSV
jgi:hypothetical protein